METGGIQGSGRCHGVATVGTWDDGRVSESVSDVSRRHSARARFSVRAMQAHQQRFRDSLHLLDLWP